MPEDDELDPGTETEETEDPGTETEDSTEDDGKGASELARARREAAKYRTQLREAQKNQTAAQKEAVSKVLKALGVDAPDDVDPEALKDLTKRQAETLRQRTTELAVARKAHSLGGDPDKLMDSVTFTKGLADLDPEDEDFEAQVADVIKSAIKKNPALRTGAQAAGSSGGAHGSGSGTGSGGKDGKEESADDSYEAVLARRAKRSRR